MIIIHLASFGKFFFANVFELEVSEVNLKSAHYSHYKNDRVITVYKNEWTIQNFKTLHSVQESGATSQPRIIRSIATTQLCIPK
jgi:hypothetical protein